MKKPELLAPGGSFHAAYYAFEGGADGVYLGLKEFSARASASNFTLEQLRRMRQLAADRNKRIYVTVNTIVAEDETARLETTLGWLDALAVDGVIVQDLGVCDVLRRRFPRLPIFASTQMALHNDEGLRVAESLGIRRVILSREVPLAVIRALRERHPGIELEVFIHGALCYSFSGACLASSALTGRSGNRGECAQICRSLFTAADGADGGLTIPECGHYFSCRDLFLGREVLELARAGVDSFKIEGRMKAPEYVLAVTRLYRAILDSAESLGDSEYDALVRDVELAFAREKTTGWLRSPSGSHLIQHEFPGHRGALLGRVASIKGRQITLRIEGDLSLRDGLGWLTPDGRELVAFSVQSLRVRGREVRFARAGTEVAIDVPPLGEMPLPARGQEIRHLSSRFLDLPLPKEAGFPLYRIPVDMEVSLDEAGTMTVSPSGLSPFATKVTVDAATRKKPFVDVLRPLFQESGESILRLGGLSFINATGLPDDGIFVPPSELKRAKNDLFAALDESFRAHMEQIGGGHEATAVEPRPLAPDLRDAVSHREALNPPGSDPIPFVAPGPWNGVDGFAECGGYRWLPLPPVIMEEGWTEALRALLIHHPDTRFAIGLNNAGHLAIAEGLADMENAWFFVDFSLYVANAACRDLLRSRVPRLLFAYAWLEGKNEALLAAGGGLPVVRIETGFRPPLFYSLGCFARHVGNRGACLEECPKSFTARVSQGRTLFDLVVRDCVTYLFEARRLGGFPRA